MRLPCLRIYNLRNDHWVMRLLLVSPTRTFLCLVFDPLGNKPYIAGANTEELAIVNLIAEREGIDARPQKRWDRFLGEFCSVAFAIAPLYSTFLHREDGVKTLPSACLLMLHCVLSRRVVNNSIQTPTSSLRPSNSMICPGNGPKRPPEAPNADSHEPRIGPYLWLHG